MTGLLSLQRQALDAFLGGDSESCAGWIEADGTPSRERIEVYRNNLRENYRRALANGYPVIERLVGDECFRGLAIRYCRQHPSTNADLQFFGRSFPAFLKSVYCDSAHAYLADVAQLELAIEDALIAHRSEAFDPAELAAIEPSDYAQVRFQLRPGLSLVGSEYPVLAIWQANQADRDGSADLASPGENLAVLRELDSAEIRRLDRSTFALAECLAVGMTLGDASARLGSQRGFDLSASLNSLFLNRCLLDFELATGDTA